MNILLLITGSPKAGVEQAAAQDRHPVVDYLALRTSLEAGGDTVEILDYQSVEEHPVGRLARLALGRPGALALLGFLRRGRFDAMLAYSESVAIPLALLLRPLGKRRPRLAVIAHRLSTGKKRLFFRALQAHREMDAIFLYATSQLQFAREALGIPEQQLRLIRFHADTCFFRPMPEVAVREDQICSAGLEWRDYPTLIEAVSALPQVQAKLAAASPWSTHVNETQRRPLPSNVEARRYEYQELRQLYAQSSFVVVSLYENDFQAGVTTILEAMAMGKAVIVTRTAGQTDVIVDGENGLSVPPGDVAALRGAIQCLRDDPALRQRLGCSARHWMEKRATLTHWVDQITQALRLESDAR